MAAMARDVARVVAAAPSPPQDAGRLQALRVLALVAGRAVARAAARGLPPQPVSSPQAVLRAYWRQRAPQQSAAAPARLPVHQ